MKFMIIAGVATMVVALSPAISSAASAAGDQYATTSPSTAARHGAFIGDGSTPGYAWTQQELTTEPGYSVGTGASQKGMVAYHDPSAPAPQSAVRGARKHQN